MLVFAVRAVPLLPNFDRFTVKHYLRKLNMIATSGFWASDSSKLHQIRFRLGLAYSAPQTR